MANQTTQGIIARLEDDTSFHVFQGRNLLWKTDNVIFGNFFLGLQSYGGWNFTGHVIPKGAEILAATVTFTANTTSGPLSGTGTLQSAFRTIDNRWAGDANRVRTGWSRQAWADFDTRVRDTSPADVIDSHGATPAPVLWAAKWTDPAVPSIAPSVRYQRISQSLDAPSTFTLGEVVLPLFRTTLPPTGNLFVDILANDPTGPNPQEPDSPDDLTVLATSDAVLASSLPPTTTADVTFAFSGLDQIVIASGTKFHVVLRVEYPPSGTTFVAWAHSSMFFGAPVIGGQGWLYGDGIGLDDQNYPGLVDVAFNRNGPHDSSIDVPWTVPAFVAGVQYTTPDIAAIVRDQVSNPQYVDGGPIGLDFIAVGFPNNRRVRAFGNPLGGLPTLDVTWRPRANRARLF